jgi:hypothetical protein
MEHKLLAALEEYESCSEKLADLRILAREGKINPDEYEAIREDWEHKLHRCQHALRRLRDDILHEAERYRQDYERNAAELEDIQRRIQAGGISFHGYQVHHDRALHVATQARKCYNWWRRILACRSSADLRLFLDEAGALEQEALLVEVAWTTLLSRLLCGMAAVLLVLAIAFPWTVLPAEGSAPSLFTLNTVALGAGVALPPYWLFVLFGAALAGAFALVQHRAPRGLLAFALGLVLMLVAAVLLQQVRCDLPGQPGTVIAYGGLTLLQIAGHLGLGAIFFGIAIAQLFTGALIDVWPARRVRCGVVLAILAGLGLSAWAATLWGGRIEENLQISLGAVKPTVVDLPMPGGRSRPVDAGIVSLAVLNRGRPAVRLVALDVMRATPRDYAVTFERRDRGSGKWRTARPHLLVRRRALYEGVVVARHPVFLHFIFAPSWPPEDHPESQAGLWRVTLRSDERSLVSEFTVPPFTDENRLAEFLLAQAGDLAREEKYRAALDLYRRLQTRFPDFARTRGVAAELQALETRTGHEDAARRLLERARTGFEENDLDDILQLLNALRERYPGTRAAARVPPLLEQYRDRAIPRALELLKEGRLTRAADLVSGLAPEQLSPQQREDCARVLVEAGRAAFENRPDAARPLFERALQFRPALAAEADFSYHYARSAALDTPRLVERLEAFLERFPDNPRAPEVRFRLGQACFAAAGEDWARRYGPRAERAFRQVLQRAADPRYQPYQVDALFGLAQTLRRLGRPLQGLALLFGADTSDPERWTDERKELLGRLVQTLRAELGWGTFLSADFDRAELEADLATAHVAHPAQLDALEGAELAAKRIVRLSVAANALNTRQIERLRDWARAGGTLWITSGAARDFDVRTVEIAFADAEAIPSTGGAAVMLENHATTAGVERVKVAGAAAVTDVAGVPGRPILEIAQNARRLYVCWTAPLGKGRVLLVPATIDRSTRQGSRFVVNLKLFALKRDIRPAPGE